MSTTTVYFPEVAGSAAATTNGMGSGTALSSTAIDVGVAVTLNSGSPLDSTAARGSFTVWTTASAAPTNLKVDIYFGSTLVRQIGSFSASFATGFVINNVTYYRHTGSWTPTSPNYRLSKGSSVTAKWWITSGSLTVYNGVLSVVATDWGDSSD